MFINPYVLHSLSAALAILFPSLGVAFGLEIAASGMLEATLRQPSAVKQISKIFVLGAAMIEGTFIAAFIVTLAMVFPSYSHLTLEISIAELGMALAIGLCACFVALASGFTIRGTCKAVARQPFFVNKIQMLAMIILTLTETPVFFALIIALFMRNNLTALLTLPQSIKMLGVGFLMGLVAVGPCIGQILFAEQSCFAVGVNRKAYNKLFTFSVLTEALIETPILLAFVLAIFILIKDFALSSLLSCAVFLSSSLVASIGALGAGFGLGYIGGHSAQKIASNPEQYPAILQTSILSSIFVETTNIFCFFVAVLILINASKT